MQPVLPDQPKYSSSTTSTHVTTAIAIAVVVIVGIISAGRILTGRLNGDAGPETIQTQQSLLQIRRMGRGSQNIVSNATVAFQPVVQGVDQASRKQRQNLGTEDAANVFSGDRVACNGVSQQHNHLQLQKEKNNHDSHIRHGKIK